MRMAKRKKAWGTLRGHFDGLTTTFVPFERRRDDKYVRAVNN